MTDVTEVDVVVVGMGPGGEAAANKLARAGLDVVAVERHLVGGECPYYACVPTKMMIRGADALAESRRVPELAGDSATTPSWRPVAQRIRDEATDDWDDTVAVKRLEDSGATLVRGHGRLAGDRMVEVDSRRFHARKAVVLDPGTAPAVPPVDGLAATPYWTNRDAAKVTELPSTLVVVGGGAVGCEMAQAFSRFGVRVTVVESGSRLLDKEEPEVSRLVTEVFTREGIRVLTDAQATTVSYADGAFRIDLGPETVEAEKLLVATGRTPQLADLGLDTVGVDPSSKSLRTDDRMRVLTDGAPLEWLYAVGDVVGHGAFTHTSMYEAGSVVAQLLGQHDAPDYAAVPRVTFTDPEVGAVGVTEEEARKDGRQVRTACVSLPNTSRGWIHKAGNDGLIKLVAEGDVLVGAVSVGPMGGEVLSMLTLAVHARVPVDRLKSMIYAYPTFHAAVRDALDQL